ncbi:uncharacterized protein TrAtP1_007714 [Trichoderma atroviride]|uniref:uncharacterized protein n=1 Tax=Hypocrea atroviridis TaxID=63577 RepID=UPI0033184776|nr:hypothetical protein TrAtP1_007714 [Trichoderma atroviride]
MCTNNLTAGQLSSYMQKMRRAFPQRMRLTQPKDCGTKREHMPKVAAISATVICLRPLGSAKLASQRLRLSCPSLHIQGLSRSVELMYKYIRNLPSYKRRHVREPLTIRNRTRKSWSKLLFTLPADTPDFANQCGKNQTVRMTTARLAWVYFRGPEHDTVAGSPRFPIDGWRLSRAVAG